MSIINEALKKAQEDLKRRDNIPLPAQPDRGHNRLPQESAAALSPTSLLPARHGKKKWSTVILGELLVVCLMVASLAVFQPRIFDTFYHPAATAAAHSALSPVSVSSPARQVQPVAVATPKPAAAGSLVLNGTMLIENKRVALINNDIYETGDSIAGKKITKITMEGVELRDGNKTITLSVRHRNSAP